MCKFNVAQKLPWVLTTKIVIFQHSDQQTRICFQNEDRLSLPPVKVRRHWFLHLHAIACSTDMDRPLQNLRRMLDSGEHESCEDGFAQDAE